jgi:hypothetical protein
MEMRVSPQGKSNISPREIWTFPYGVVPVKEMDICIAYLKSN